MDPRPALLRQLQTQVRYGRERFFQVGRELLTRPISIAHRRLNRAGVLVSANDRRLFSLKDIHQGQRAFVIGMGPSLRTGDLDRLKGEITFACNKVYLAFDQTSWRPTYYSLVDDLVAKHNREEIQKLKLSKLIGRCVKPYFGDDGRTIFFREFPQPRADSEDRFRFSTDAVEGVHAGWTVIYEILQLAYYMGIREVYLIGVDFFFQPPKQGSRKGLFREFMVSGGEQNHFHAGYRKKGEMWNMPRLDMQYRAFLCAKEAFEAAGGVIYNASRQTALDVFERVAFDDIV